MEEKFYPAGGKSSLEGQGADGRCWLRSYAHEGVKIVKFVLHNRGAKPILRHHHYV
jgi:hypothetical protein